MTVEGIVKTLKERSSIFGWRTRISKQQFAGPEVPYEARVVLVVANAHRDVFKEQVAFADEEPPYKYYWAHACVLNGIWKIPPINYGPGGGEASVLPDERISIAQLLAAAKVYALVALEAYGVTE
jgi:acetylornithine deacetylase/succinyl-diaminopimelate desuccinylase-like protein